MTRLPRSRKGKTPLDVTITHQPAGLRVRVTLGNDGYDKKNSDLDAKECDDLIVLLQYNLAKIKGELPLSVEEVVS